MLFCKCLWSYVLREVSEVLGGFLEVCFVEFLFYGGLIEKFLEVLGKSVDVFLFLIGCFF